MFHLPDVETLGLCSTLASLSFALVFGVLWGGRRSEDYLLHWAASSLLYALVLIALDTVARDQPLAVACLFGLLCATDVLIVSGANRFEGRKPFRGWMLLPVVLGAAGHALPALLAGDSARASGAGGAAGLACGMGVAGLVLLRGRVSHPTRGRRIAGAAMLAYLPGYAIAAAEPFIGGGAHSNLLALVPMLSDQLLLGILNLGLIAMPAERARARLREAALRDPLTGVWNRAGLQVQEARLLAPGAAVIAIDVDRFKAINDRQGHAGGDRVLIELARGAEALARSHGGELARIGGDEFVAFLPPGEAPPLFFAERLRTLCRPKQGAGPAWTVSVGVGVIAAGEASMAGALSRADGSLYRAKALGRDRVAA